MESDTAKRCHQVLAGSRMGTEILWIFYCTHFHFLHTQSNVYQSKKIFFLKLIYEHLELACSAFSGIFVVAMVDVPSKLSCWSLVVVVVPSKLSCWSLVVVVVPPILDSPQLSPLFPPGLLCSQHLNQIHKFLFHRFSISTNLRWSPLTDIWGLLWVMVMLTVGMFVCFQILSKYQFLFQELSFYTTVQK